MTGGGPAGQSPKPGPVTVTVPVARHHDASAARRIHTVWLVFLKLVRSVCGEVLPTFTFTEIPALGRDSPAGGVGLSELNPREDLNMATAIDFKLKDLRQIYVCGVVHTI